MFFTVPSTPVQNIRIVNVTDDPVITVVLMWDPPSHPNGIIRYYRIEFQQLSDGGGNLGRKKRVVPVETELMNVFANITGFGEAPTNLTLSNLGMCVTYFYWTGTVIIYWGPAGGTQYCLCQKNFYIKIKG